MPFLTFLKGTGEQADSLNPKKGTTLKDTSYIHLIHLSHTLDQLPRHRFLHHCTSFRRRDWTFRKAGTSAAALEHVFGCIILSQRFSPLETSFNCENFRSRCSSSEMVSPVCCLQSWHFCNNASVAFANFTSWANHSINQISNIHHLKSNFKNMFSNTSHAESCQQHAWSSLPARHFDRCSSDCRCCTFPNLLDADRLWPSSTVLSIGDNFGQVK